MMSGGHECPTAHPARAGSECTRGPREHRSAVGFDTVEFFIGDGDKEHRNEREDDDAGRLETDESLATEHNEPECRCERVRRRRRGHSDDDARDEPECPSLETLLSCQI